MTQILPTSFIAASYAKFKTILSGLGKTAPIITRTDIRIEQVADPNKNIYIFNPEASTGNGDRPLEHKLEKDEIFFATGISLGIQKQKPGTSGEDQAVNPLMYSPDPNYFTVAGEADALRNIYQGTMKVTTAGSERTSDILTHHLELRYGQPYQSAAATPNPNAELPNYGPMHGERGYHELYPSLNLDGNASNKIELTLGNGLRTAINADANSDNVLVLMLHGFLYSGDDANGFNAACR